MNNAQQTLQVIQLIGIILASSLSAISLYVNVKANRKGAYIKEVTTLKAKYIENLRLVVAEFAALAFECNRATLGVSTSDKDQLMKEVNLKYAHTLLFLNNEDSIDKKLDYYLYEIKKAAVSKGQDGMLIGATIETMLTYTQQVLLFEWRNLRHEAKKGRGMTDQEKQQRRDEFMKKYDIV